MPFNSVVFKKKLPEEMQIKQFASPAGISINPNPAPVVQQPMTVSSAPQPAQLPSFRPVANAAVGVGKSFVYSPIRLANQIAYPIIESQARNELRQGKIGYDIYKNSVDKAAQAAGLNLNDSSATVFRKIASPLAMTTTDVLTLGSGNKLKLAGSTALGGLYGLESSLGEEKVTPGSVATNVVGGGVLGAGVYGASKLLQKARASEKDILAQPGYRPNAGGTNPNVGTGSVESGKSFTGRNLDNQIKLYREGKISEGQLKAMANDYYTATQGKAATKADIDGLLAPVFKNKTSIDEATFSSLPASMQKAIADKGMAPQVTNQATKGTAPTIKLVEKAAAKSPPEVNPLDIHTKSNLWGEFRTALVDRRTPVLDTLRQIEKKTGQTGLVDQFMYDSGLVTRSNAIANNRLVNDPNLKSALYGLTGQQLNDFNRYAMARSELYNASKGLKTSADKTVLKEIVDNLHGEYGARFESMNKFYKGYADDMYKAGIIDKATHKRFISNPDYIRTQRDMGDLIGLSSGKGQGYSLGSSFTSQKRTGSVREMQPADLTAMEYAQKAQLEIQKNQAASGLIDVLYANGLARPLTSKEAVNSNTIKRLVNGKVEIYEIPPEIKQVVDNINPYQLNALSRIVSMPKRVFQAGTTGLSAPFTIANYGKDQGTAALNSKEALSVTHNPKNILNGLWQASKDFAVNDNDPIWQKFLAHSGDVTQYDLTRNVSNAKQLSRQLRYGESGRVVNMIMSPIKTLEDLVSVTEKATRFQNFKGIYENALKNGESEQAATVKATLAAWQHTVDFNSFGEWGKTLNLIIPYFNSGIQGSRTLARSFAQRPVATAVKTLGLLGLPIIGATAWNLSDQGRRDVYFGQKQPDGSYKGGISEFEKENNMIIIPPGQSGQNKDGTYNVWKIPLPQGYVNLITPIRRVMESYAKQSPVNFAKIATDITGALSGPINTNSPGQAASGLVPQAIKPLVQQAANKDFFTNKPIVPDYVDQATNAQGQPIAETQKVFDYSSGTARAIGGALNQSPIRVEKFLKDTFGKVGQYGLNASDNLLAAAGKIPQEQIGGTSILEDISRRFTDAQSDYNFQKSAGAKYFDDVKQATSGLNSNEKAAYNTLHPANTNFLGEDIFDENKRITKYTKAGVYLQFPKVYEADKALDRIGREKGNPGNPLFDLTHEQLTRVLLKATLPPGSKDPELSNLYQQEWYQDYNVKRTAYYEAVKSKLAKEGKSLPQSDNPYPETPKALQDIMNYYSSLPKGTGARSAFIRANPDAFNAMTNQWSAIDAWENKERVAIGLSPIDQQASSTGSSSYNKSSGGSSGKSSSSKAKKGVAFKIKKPFIKKTTPPGAGKKIILRTPKVVVKTTKG